MAAKAKAKRKVKIGGTVDSDVASWLMKTKGNDKFSKHLNDVLRNAMESGSDATAVASFRRTLDDIRERVVSLQERVEGLEGARPEAKAKRGRGRPRKNPLPAGGRGAQPLADYSVGDDVQWFLARDKHGKVKAGPLVNAFGMVTSRFDGGEPVTVGLLKDSYDPEAIGVPYPTFRLFYWPLIRDRLLEKKIIAKVERPGKKGVYRKQ